MTRPSPTTPTRGRIVRAVALTVALSLLAVAVPGVGSAQAYLSAQGAGVASGVMGSLDPATSVTVPGSSSGTVRVTWVAPAASATSAAPTGYTVTRTLSGPGSVAAACGTGPASVLTALTCDDLSVPAGTFTYQVTAVYRSWTAASAPSGSVVVAPAAKLAFQTQPSNATVGTAFPIQPVVVVQDAAGAAVAASTAPVTLTLTVAGGANLSCGASTSRNAVAGTAAFSSCAVTTAGSYTLTASSAGLASAQSVTFTVAGPATKLAFTVSPSNSTGGTAFSTQPVVTIQDAGGRTVTSSAASVTLTITTPAGAVLTCAPNPAAASGGVVTFAGCSINRRSGTTYTLTAASAGLTGVVSSAFTVSTGTAAKLAFTRQPSASSASATSFASQPRVTVQDAGGNTVTSSTAPVTLSLTTPAGASLTCTANPRAAASGIATFAACKVNKTGTYTLTATSGTLTSAVSSSFAITAGAAAKLAFSVQPSGGPRSVALPTQPQVTVQDASGNTVTTSTASVTLALTTPGGATLSCTANPKATVAGVAAFAGCAVNTAATYTFTASSGTLASAASAAFTLQ